MKHYVFKGWDSSSIIMEVQQAYMSDETMDIIIQAISLQYDIEIDLIKVYEKTTSETLSLIQQIRARKRVNNNER